MQGMPEVTFPHILYYLAVTINSQSHYILFADEASVLSHPVSLFSKYHA
jgi:hypothetical protein